MKYLMFMIFQKLSASKDLESMYIQQHTDQSTVNAAQNRAEVGEKRVRMDMPLFTLILCP